MRAYLSCFSKKHCDGNPIRWNVPIGTVLSIDITPKIKPRLSDIIGNRERYTQTRDQHLPDIVYYTDNKEGLTLQVFANGEVSSFFYGPAAKDIILRCADTSTQHALPGERLKFDEYTKLPFKKEKVRLSYFAIQLRQQPGTKGYIVVHSARTRALEGRARGERSRTYLVKAQNIPTERIVVLEVEGNYAESPVVELYLVPASVSDAIKYDLLRQPKP